MPGSKESMNFFKKRLAKLNKANMSLMLKQLEQEKKRRGRKKKKK